MKTRAFLLTLSLAVCTPALAETTNNNPTPVVQTAAADSIYSPLVNDPYEGYNRVMFKVNDVADRYVMTPVAKGYRAVTPKPVRASITNFFDNLRDVVSFGSNLLRLDIKRASEDFARVALNSTFGLGGLINFADAGGMPNNKNTLGDTFASWGWKSSHYFVVPMLGPSTVRDTVGNAITTVYAPSNAVFDTNAARIASTATNLVNTREGLLDLTDGLDEAALDKYAYVRDIYMRMRANQLGVKTEDNAGEEVDIDALVAPETDGGANTETPAVPSENLAPNNTEATSETVSETAETLAPVASDVATENGETANASSESVTQ
ncbi:MAG: VacJ family lipoprotein [Neisseria sp.]|nr:VacJ family lipoprotein [Neisseria sp.]